MTKSNSKPQRAGRLVSLSLDPSGGANPADAAGANINTIVAQYRANGTMPNISMGQPLYGDHTAPTDLQDALDLVESVQNQFNELPSDVRSAAENNPVQFLHMFADPAGREILQSAGLIITPPQANEAHAGEPPTPAPSENTTTPPVPPEADA